MIIPVSFILRSITLLVFFIWWLYWAVTKKTAEREKPPTKHEGAVNTERQIRRFILKIAQVIMLMQVTGITILPLPFPQFIVQSLGFILVVLGAIVAISARKILGTNWANAHEYQIKNEQDLVTSGIY